MKLVQSKNPMKLNVYLLQNAVLLEASPLWQIIVPKSKSSNKVALDTVNVTARLGGKNKEIIDFCFSM